MHSRLVIERIARLKRNSQLADNIDVQVHE